MATILPDSIDLYSVDFRSQPSLTWYIDKSSQRISGETDGQAAVRQAVEIIVNTERFRWQIYQPYSGVQLDSLIGQSPSYAGAELQKRIQEALLVDDRVTGISDFTYSVAGTVMTASFTVNTVYGAFQTRAEVTLQ